MANVARGVSTVLGYSLNLLVATLLVTGLLIAAGALVDSQRDQMSRAELQVVGERLVANLETADRLARTGNDGHVTVESTLPSRVAGSSYRVAIVADGNDSRVVLRSESPENRVVVPINNETPINPSNHSGGSLSVTWNESEPLEVRDD
ncbi:MAG: DUF7266 family protein [archaeon]